jgi:hypothetical protein
MAGSFPTANFKTMSWRSNNNIVTTETLTNKIFSKDIGGHYWSFTLKSVPLLRADFDPIWSFLVQQKGSFDTFTVVPPDINSTKGTFTNSSGTNLPIGVSASAGATSVIATPTGSGTLKAGDLIKFSNHDKIYMLTADVTLSNGSAETLNIFPALISGVTNANDVLTEDISIKVRLTNDVQTFSTGVDDVFEYEIDVRESL